MKWEYSPDELAGRPVWVLGLGRSGQAAAKLLKDHEAEVFVTEVRPREEVRLAAEDLEREGIEVQTGGHDFTGRPLPEFAVLSPGIPTSAVVVEWLTRRGRPVFSEIEVASWFYYGTVVAITGSNGKTTTTRWIAHVLQQAGLSAVATGNIGYPFCSLVREQPKATHAIVEVSSFQLESIQGFRPHVAVITNISPDHLDRHGDIQSYARAKARIWENQDEHDWAVIPLGDRLVAEISLSIKPQKVYVSLEECPRGGAGLEGGKLLLDLSGKREVLLPAAELPLPGRHNIANAISAAAACSVLQISSREIAAGLRTFPGVEHRLELVGRNGRTWINDSKSTNVDSLRVALEAIPGPVWLIAGGRDKGTPYAPLEPLVRDRVERLLLIGEAARRIEEELGSAAAVCVCGTLEKAVQYAAQFAPPGVSVLLSPACASFDQFENYEQRGETYRRLVEENAGI